MFLLVSVRQVGAQPCEHQHGVSKQISISLGKTFLRISRIRNIPLLSWILARVFVYVPPFISQILDFIYWTVLIIILTCLEWRETENQQFFTFLSFFLFWASFPHHYAKKRKKIVRKATNCLIKTYFEASSIKNWKNGLSFRNVLYYHFQLNSRWPPKWQPFLSQR